MDSFTLAENQENKALYWLKIHICGQRIIFCIPLRSNKLRLSDIGSLAVSTVEPPNAAQVSALLDTSFPVR